MTSFDSVDAFFAALPNYFSSEAAADVDTVVQFEFIGSEPQEPYYVVVRHGELQVGKGRHDGPETTVTSRPDHWLAVVNGELKPAAAFLTRKLKVSGAVHLATRIPELFGIR